MVKNGLTAEYLYLLSSQRMLTSVHQQQIAEAYTDNEFI